MRSAKSVAAPGYAIQDVRITSQVEVRGPLQQRGWGHLKGQDLRYAAGLEIALQDFANAYQVLPADQYCSVGCRYRRLSRFLAKPWLGELEPLPHVTYLQGEAFNSLDGGRARWFEPLRHRDLTNPFLEALIWFDLYQLPLPERQLLQPLVVGVHMIKVTAEPGRPGLSSPNVLHKDGEPFTAIHLIERQHVTGGQNTVALNEHVEVRDEIPVLTATPFEVTLEHPLDTVIVVDARVWHHVSAIHVAPGCAQGWRSVLLIDVSPLVAEVTPL